MKEKYGSAMLSQSQRKVIMSEVEQLFSSKKLHKHPDLSLRLLASEMGIPESYVSQAINMQLGRNFNEYVNERRIEEVCQSLKTDVQNSMTMEQHAFAAGFNSMSSFYGVFRKFMGMTPSQYRKRSRN